ncbi:hypothetical protein [Flavisolibacter tropicus]|uniref:Lipoprotein n=1 Tax=Flavisolibacter tropicus TaxID=1492898 RepID=A0A172U207_9BACT|nr:hypothetical protein [Flavisolibacter tropicus]ANE53037.1 hypothetical protein SY85_23740 [Flavisolibacter tropicus]
MNKHICSLATISLMAFSLAGCIGSKLGSANNKEKVQMNIKEKVDVIDYALLKEQTVPSFASRGQSRGPMTGLTLGAVSLATNAVKQMIAKDKKKYTAEYDYALTDLYFYDQLSTENPFDPIGMQFSGFRLVRTFQNKGVTDTAMIADFELDATNPYEIINNSIFRLKLKSLQLNYAKAKVPANNKLLNMDFEISFHTSYVNGQGVLFKNIELGKFYFFLRKAPLDKNEEGYTAYFEKLKGKKLEGQSFIVPRSFGYHMSNSNTVEPAYSQGAYTIQVKVKESSKNTFVNQMIIDNSNKLVDALGDQLKKKLK